MTYRKAFELSAQKSSVLGLMILTNAIILQIYLEGMEEMAKKIKCS